MILVLDTENQTHSKGSPFDQRNFNVCISYATATETGCRFTADEHTRADIERLLRESTTLVFFNAKYDLHWLRKLGYDFSGKRIWCCQTAEFTLGRQASPYPDLDGTALAYDVGRKSTVIEDEYWSKGIQTADIPRDTLSAYAVQDAVLTWRIYHKQQEKVGNHQRVLFSLLMQDLLVLEEMEWNGLRFDKEYSLQKAKEVDARIEGIQQQLDLFHSVPSFNWASNDHLSALLYGGTITERRRIPIGVYKTGAKIGETRFRVEPVEHRLPRRYNPIRGSELAKEGYWSVDESYLAKLRGDKALIGSILEVKGLKKLVNTYLRGLPAKHEEAHQPDGFIHGQLVQCVAATGRLASNSPNLQNISGQATDIFVTRYP